MNKYLFYLSRYEVLVKSLCTSQVARPGLSFLLCKMGPGIFIYFPRVVVKMKWHHTKKAQWLAYSTSSPGKTEVRWETQLMSQRGRMRARQCRRMALWGTVLRCLGQRWLSFGSLPSLCPTLWLRPICLRRILQKAVIWA